MMKSKKALLKMLRSACGEVISVGDTVFCDPEHCYVSYTHFAKKHPKYIARFAYKCMPNEKHTFKIIGVHNHVIEDFYDANEIVVVVESTVNRQIFFMGEHGVHKVTGAR